jgi:RNA polymerase sigma factor (sigma-70 family)
MKLSNEQLKDGLLRNDPEVFRYLYRTHGSMIVAYVRKNSGSEHDAREMVQSVLLELWNAVRENRYREEGKLDRYLYMLTANTWRDELRRRKVRQSEALNPDKHQLADESDSNIVEAVVKDQRIDAIHHCLQLLEAPCDDIIRLYHLEEISLQDVAAQMQYDYNNLRKRIFDCRKKLKKLVDQYLEKHETSTRLDF